MVSRLRKRRRRRRSGKGRARINQRTLNIVHGDAHAHGVLAQWTITAGAAPLHMNAMTVTTEGVHRVLMLVVPGHLLLLIAIAAGTNTVHEGAEAEAAVPSLVIGAEMIAFVLGPAPTNPMTTGGTIRKVRGMAIDMPTTRGSADEVLVL
jgi:hypothetical protein